MKLKLVLVVVSWGFCLTMTAGDQSPRGETLFECDFANNRELRGWLDVAHWKTTDFKNSMPQSDKYKVVTDNGETYLKTQSMFGLTSLLKKELLVDESIDWIELKVTLRKPLKDGYLAQIALTSRKTPAGNDGGAFWRGQKDSGFLAQGYQYDLQYANFIFWQKAGRRVRMSAVKPPFNLLVAVEKWATWRLIYKHHVKELWFYRSEEEQKPFIIQRGVDLTGVTLNSVWISSWGTEYMDVKVLYGKKEE